LPILERFDRGRSSSVIGLPLSHRQFAAIPHSPLHTEEYARQPILDDHGDTPVCADSAQAMHAQSQTPNNKKLNPSK
jgi:hypothetical protein